MAGWTQRRRAVLRVGLAVVALTPALVGIWATVSPHGFYSSFPGLGRHWVSLVSRYDEHLVRDVGALYLGMLVVLGLAWWWLDRRLVQAALVASAVAAAPHLIYHLTALGGFSTGDAIAEIAGLALNLLLPLCLLVVAAPPTARSA